MFLVREKSCELTVWCCLWFGRGCLSYLLSNRLVVKVLVQKVGHMGSTTPRSNKVC